MKVAGSKRRRMMKMNCCRVQESSLGEEALELKLEEANSWSGEKPGASRGKES
jgi:hypothetical protein